ncbi:hypothetical protein B1L04_04535 [Microcystis aeruginosa KW]|uniref:Uncharacterized protein n=1 Tax=Microcystis aeruginosa KW TaxID=1960155 RepID=A0A1V4BVT8_MICAE|nr:hypothetical protein B1L04_04535 [Microcystis aeruginosa KW]
MRQKVRAKHSDRKSTVSPIGYCPNASPLQDVGFIHESTLPFIKIKIFLILSHRRPEVVTDN